MKKIFILSILLLVLSHFSSCQKSFNKKIRLTGAFSDWFDHTPVRVIVNVNAQDAYSHEMEKISITSFKNESDGSFDKEVPAARSDDYYFDFYTPDGYSISPDSVSREGSTFNFGVTKTPHSFVCKVHLVRNPGSVQSIKFTSGHIVAFDHSPDTSYYESQTISYNKNGAYYHLNYTIFSGTSSDKVIAVPISQSDTVKTEIIY